MLAVFVVVAIVTSVTVGLATNLDQIPEHDEFGYVTNPLYYSGVHPSNATLVYNTTIGSETYHPFYSERPPLFWWLITSLIAVGLNPIVSIIISPLFAVLLALLISQFAYELTGDPKAALFAGLLTGFSAFFATISSHILTDAMGTFFAALTIYCFYEFFFKQRKMFGVLMGASLALSLITRDENLILIPLLVILWIALVLKASAIRKFLYLVIFAIIFGAPVLLFGLVGTLQGISNVLTPLVLNGWPIIIIIVAIAAYVSYRAKGVVVGELAAAFLAFFILMLPFFFDNYYLGNVEYYVAGKGILARPVSHLIMAQTIGVGSGLSLTARAEVWITSLPALLSVTLMIFSLAGLYYVFRADRRQFVLLFIWTALSLGYVVFGTQLEDRFLMIAFAQLAILAGIGIAFVWKLNPFAGVVAAAFSFVLADFVPRSAFKISNLVIIAGGTAKTRSWVFLFLSRVSLSPPHPILPYYDLADGFFALLFGVAVTLFILKSSVVEPTTIPVVEYEPIGQSQDGEEEGYEQELAPQQQHQMDES
jgi:4-amino-4-deoxy-L-arabinose transferase-like glycosyltransferase